MTIYTGRLIIVVKAAIRTQANDLTSKADTGNTTTATFTVPLERAGSVVAYWCSWQLTQAHIDAIRTRLRAAGLSDVVVSGAQKGTYVPNESANVYLFDGRDGQWTPQEVLNVLNLRTVASSSVAA